MRESERNLDQIKLDNNLMRRDLASYENEVEGRLNVSGACNNMANLIEGHTKQIKTIIEQEGDEDQEFFDSLINNIEEL